MSRSTTPCVVCNRDLENVMDDSINQASGGLSFITYGQYGSRIFDPMDGSYLELNICDKCTTKLGKEKRVWFGRSSKLLFTPGRCVIGSTRITRELVEWNPDVEHQEEIGVVIDDYKEWMRLKELGFDISSKFSDKEIEELFLLEERV